MSTASRALIAIVPSFLIALVLFVIGSGHNRRALEAATGASWDVAASYETSAAVYVATAVLVMCFGPALWLIATREGT